VLKTLDNLIPEVQDTVEPRPVFKRTTKEDFGGFLKTLAQPWYIFSDATSTVEYQSSWLEPRKKK